MGAKRVEKLAKREKRKAKGKSKKQILKNNVSPEEDRLVDVTDNYKKDEDSIFPSIFKANTDISPQDIIEANGGKDSFRSMDEYLEIVERLESERKSNECDKYPSLSCQNTK